MARILVVDDDAAVRQGIELLLEDAGHQVVGTADGRSGLHAASEQPFDLVIVDIFMPGMDGLEAIRNFHQVLPRVPIIAMSGFMFRTASALTPDFLAMASKLGAACSLPKPFKPEELLGAVQLCLPPNRAAT